jgi:hypothetical protein
MLQRVLRASSTSEPNSCILTHPLSEKKAPFHWLLSVLEHLLSQHDVPATPPQSPPVLPPSNRASLVKASTNISCFKQELQSLVSLWSLRHSFPKLLHLLSPAARPPPDVRVFSVCITGPHGNRCASPRSGEGFAIIICNKALAPFLHVMRDGCANCTNCLLERKANPYLSALFGCKTLRSPVLYQAIMAGGGDPALQVFSAVVRHTDSCFSFLASKQ